jgi:hypothetical protein
MRINGATVKAALLPAARRQLFSATSMVSPRATGVVSFNGESAYTQYSVRSGEIVSWGINYPSLPDNAMLTRKEADLLVGYTLHEIGHVLYTENGALHGADPFLFKLWNGLEDARIEAAMIASGKAIGARSAFKRLLSRHTVSLPGFNPCRLSNAPFALAVLGRAAYGNGNGFANRLMNRIPAPKRALYEAAVSKLVLTPLDRSGTALVLYIAKEFLADWRAIEPEKEREIALAAPESAPPAPSDEAIDAAQDADNDDGAFDDLDEGDSPVAKPGPSDKHDLGTGDPFDDEEEGEEEREEDGLGYSGSDWEDEDDEDDPRGWGGKPIEKSEERKAADAEIAKAERDLDDVPAPGGFGGPSIDEDEEEEDVEEEAYEDTDESGPVRSPELGVDDVFANIRARTVRPIELAPISPPGRTNMTKWESVLALTDRQVSNDVRRLSKVAKSPALKTALARILRAPERTGRDTGASGRFDPRKYGKMIAGSELVMKQLWMEPGIGTAVSIVIDASGSMSGEPMKLAVETAWVFAEACEAAGAAVEVVAYRGDYSTYVPSAGETIGGQSSNTLPGLPGDPATVITIKPFSLRLARCAGAFRFAGKIADGGTPDYTAVRDACHRLVARPEERKVVLSVTDGCGEIAEMKQLCAFSHQLFGVDVIGIGIGIEKETMEWSYDDGLVIRSISELEGVGLKALARKLDSRDTRRKW